MASRAGIWIAIVSALAALCPATADMLELRDGRRLEGRLLGGSPQELHFETSEGVLAIPRDRAVSLHFAGSTAQAAPGAEGQPGASTAPAAPAAAPATSPATPVARQVVVPAGTKLRVRLGDSIDPRQATQGDRFSALLEAPLLAGELTVLPARSIAYGVVTATSPTGPPSHRLQLELVELQVGGEPIPVVTGTQQRLEAPGAPAPANAAPPGEARVPSGAILEFRMLQPLELTLRPR